MVSPSSDWPNGWANIDPLRSYRNLFDGFLLPANNPELIFTRGEQIYKNNEIELSNTRGLVLHQMPKDDGGWNCHGLTQKMVDAYYMNDGTDCPGMNSEYAGVAGYEGRVDSRPRLTGFTTIEDLKAGRYPELGWEYDPSRPDSEQDATGMNVSLQYVNREPRFYASILYNKRVIPALRTNVEERDYYSSPGQQNGFGRVELYYGGISRQSGSYTFYPMTGALALKRNDPQADMHNRVWPQKYCSNYIRYAEILLDYIEALNEYDPTNPDIRKYWDMIRDRAGVPSAFVATPEIAGNQDLQREYIIRERQIELCFETDRYFTTRRRWVAHTPDEGGMVDDRKYGEGGRVWGFSVNAGDASTNDFSFEGFYQRTAFESRVFNKAYYLFPIPQSEIDKSTGLVQNPWW